MDNCKKREFLEPQEDGTYKYVEWTCLTCPPEDYVEIPKMAKMLTKDRNNYLTFWDGDFSRSPYIDSNWLNPDVDDVMDFAAYKQLGDFKILWKRSDQDPALISGADALRALADGKEVEANNSDFGYWIDARNLGVKDFFDDVHIFRLKPTILKVNAELPKPNKEIHHNSLAFAVTYEFPTREERNAFADKLRGTNS